MGDATLLERSRRCAVVSGVETKSGFAGVNDDQITIPVPLKRLRNPRPSTDRFGES